MVHAYLCSLTLHHYLPHSLLQPRGNSLQFFQCPCPLLPAGLHTLKQFSTLLPSLNSISLFCRPRLINVASFRKASCILGYIKFLCTLYISFMVLRHYPSSLQAPCGRDYLQLPHCCITSAKLMLRPQIPIDEQIKGRWVRVSGVE